MKTLGLDWDNFLKEIMNRDIFIAKHIPIDEFLVKEEYLRYLHKAAQ